MSTKKSEQLGMNPSTAAHRLRVDVLFSLVVEVGRDTCYRCGESISREDFSLDHKVDWLDSGSPVVLYFDLENVAFSHKACNYGAARSAKKYETEEERVAMKKHYAKLNRQKHYDPERRRQKYLRNGT